MATTQIKSLPYKLQEQLKRDSIFAGVGPNKIRHLVPPHNLKLEGTPLWMTRCGIEWPDGPWYQAIPWTGRDDTEWCQACLKQAGVKQAAKSDELYELAVREWIARQLSNDRRTWKADDISDVKYGVDFGFRGSDVTPGDDPEPTITCTLAGQKNVEVSGITPVQLVVECLQIVEELRLQPIAP